MQACPSRMYSKKILALEACSAYCGSREGTCIVRMYNNNMCEVC